MPAAATVPPPTPSPCRRPVPKSFNSTRPPAPGSFSSVWKRKPAAKLGLGVGKRVELARALAGRPALLLLDEPAGGLNHEEVMELGVLIRAVRDRLGITVLLVEHHMGRVMILSDQVVVLNFGRVIADGPPDAVRNNSAVTEAYLGPRH